ncbi:glycerophosphodiester phosphodiesterase [Lacticaseibacillus camelliae]|uniref:glycerophosphodiester phosphodiesterase n=1 Tax=Lacticaseibacillus camelliae TaxID=381742 RepID=UPI0006D145F9|nr:glycerophosphodiester phosphodiesterase family protein [Lacticaseibacillus camelliae]
MYTSDGQWQGYINQVATKVVAGPQGNWLKTNFYATVTNSAYPLMKNFAGLHTDAKNLYQQTFHVTGEYKPTDGQTYYSLYNEKIQWVGYLDARAVKTVGSAQGAWLAHHETMIVAKVGYPFWPRLFSGNVKNTSAYIGQAVTINGMYHHLNGGTYYSVYQAGHWLGYVNAAALSANAVHVAPGFAMSAHRGDHAVAPENSLAAITAAKDAGYGIVEMDIRETKDHQYVLMHDDTIDRTTNGTGKVASLTLAQVEATTLNVSGYPALVGQTLRVPTFDQAIDAAAADGLFVNLDGSKENWADQAFTDHVVAKLKADNIYASSFFVLSNATLRKTFMTRYPDARITWLYSAQAGIRQTLAELRTYQHSLLTIADTQVTPAIIAEATKDGIPVHVYGVNNVDRASELKAEGVTYIESDSVTPSQLSIQ